MRHLFVLALLVSAWGPAISQQNKNPTPPAPAKITAPVLLPSTLSISTPRHCDEFDGVVKLAATIDSAGTPRDLKILNAGDQRLVGFATEIVEAQRFKPGTVDNAPAAVTVELTIGLHTCAQRIKHPTDGEFYDFTLRAHPMIALTIAAAPETQQAMPTPHTQVAAAEQVSEHISAPIPTVVTDPEIPVSRKLPKHGLCILGLTVDANGVPQNIHLFRGLDPELDSNAIEAAKTWRFKPALREGHTPVAVEATIVAKFESIEKEPVAFSIFVPKAPEKILAPKATDQGQHLKVEPLNADEVIARYKPQSRIAGRCLVSLMIDKNGVPQNVHVVKGVDSSLDLETAAMVEHLRFKVETTDGSTPDFVWLVLPINYRVNTWKNVLYSAAIISIFFFG